MSGEESSPLEGTSQQHPERSMRTGIVLILAALVMIVVAYSYFGTRDQSLDFEHDSLVSQQQEDGLVCCMLALEHGIKSYLILLTRELEGEFHTVVFRVMEFQEDGSPREINAIGSPFPSQLPTSFNIVEQTAYVPVYGEDHAGVWTIDLSDPEWPETIGFAATGEGESRQLEASGDRLAINHTNQITLADISSRHSPEPVGRIDQEASAVVTLAMDEERLFVNDVEFDKLRVYDATNDGSPEQLGSHRNPDGPGELEIRFGVENAADRLNASVMPDKYLDVDLHDDLLWVAASNLGVRALDVTDPSDIFIVKELDLPDRAARLSRVGERLYVLGASEGNVDQIEYAIHTIDISNPESPEHLDTIDGVLTEPGLQAFYAAGDRVFLGLHETLLVFDVAE